jgi:hypothetical protein
VPPDLIGSYFVSRRVIHQKSFGPPQEPPASPDAPQGREAQRLTRLKNAAHLAKSVKRLLELRLILPPDLTGPEAGIRSTLLIYAGYIFLTEKGIQAAKALMLESRFAACGNRV